MVLQNFKIKFGATDYQSYILNILVIKGYYSVGTKEATPRHL